MDARLLHPAFLLFSTSRLSCLAATLARCGDMQVQYRMHPVISAFANASFYAGRIRDGPAVEAKTAAPYHRHAALGPLAFFDVDGTEDMPEGSLSLRNMDEVAMVVALLQTLIREVRRYCSSPLGLASKAIDAN